MSNIHWEAFTKIPDTLMLDTASIFFHAGISWLEDLVRTTARQSMPGSAWVDYVVDGFGSTIKQDYGFNLIGMAHKLDTKKSGEAGLMNY